MSRLLCFTVIIFEMFLLVKCQINYDEKQKPIGILKFLNDISPDGSYEYAYETENGIFAQEEGRVRQSAESQSQEDVFLAVQGSFLYTSPEGQEIHLTYTADENGFHPQGNHLPTPPPIPQAILRALEWNKAHPEEDNQI